MTEYVRVADVETGHHMSIPRRRFDRNPSLWRELKQPATYADGTPRPVKHKTSVSQEAAKKQQSDRGQTADTEKEK